MPIFIHCLSTAIYKRGETLLSQSKFLYKACKQSSYDDKKKFVGKRGFEKILPKKFFKKEEGRKWEFETFLLAPFSLSLHKKFTLSCRKSKVAFFEDTQNNQVKCS